MNRLVMSRGRNLQKAQKVLLERVSIEALPLQPRAISLMYRTNGLVVAQTTLTARSNQTTDRHSLDLTSGWLSKHETASTSSFSSALELDMDGLRLSSYHTRALEPQSLQEPSKLLQTIPDRQNTSLPSLFAPISSEVLSSLS